MGVYLLIPLFLNNLSIMNPLNETWNLVQDEDSLTDKHSDNVPRTCSMAKARRSNEKTKLRLKSTGNIMERSLSLTLRGIILPFLSLSFFFFFFTIVSL